MTRPSTSRLRHRGLARWSGALAATALLGLVCSAPATAANRSVLRVSGADRYATAVAVSQQAFPTGSGVVVIVDALAFPDALTAAPAAGTLGAPILPVQPGSLPSAVRAEVTRLGAKTALIVGGDSAVGSPVVTALQGMGLSVARASGANRYETAAKVATSVVSTSAHPTNVLIASGTVFADGLVGGAYGAATGTPLLLTDPQGLPAATASALASLHPGSITVLGGPSAVSDTVLTQLRTYTSGSVQRVYGADRYGTAAALQQQLWTNAPTALLASGTAFPDALAAGALGVPIVLSRPTCLPRSSSDALGAWGTTSTLTVGGTSALGDAAAGGSLCSS